MFTWQWPNCLLHECFLSGSSGGGLSILELIKAVISKTDKMKGFSPFIFFYRLIGPGLFNA